MSSKGQSQGGKKCAECWGAKSVESLRTTNTIFSVIVSHKLIGKLQWFPNRHKVSTTHFLLIATIPNKDDTIKKNEAPKSEPNEKKYRKYRIALL